MAKGKLALVVAAGLGAALLASGSGGDASPVPKPRPVPPPKPTGKDEEIPRAVLERIAKAVQSGDPEVLRAEAKRLRAEGYIAQAKGLEELADEIEAKSKVPVNGTDPKPPPPPPKPPTTVRDLVRGMKGDDVKIWQTQLVHDGYVNTVVDGVFGDLTFAATKEWQWERELKDDGIVGAKTRAAIGTAPKRKRPAPAKPPVASSPAPAKPPTPTKPPTTTPVPAKPPAVTAPPKPPTATKPPAQPKPGTGKVPKLLVGVTLRKVPPPEPFDARVVAWQDQLKALGYRTATTASDGKFGPNTEKQTKAFQKASGLDEDGIAGPITIATAFSAPIPLLGPVPLSPPPAAASPVVPPLKVNLASWRSVLKKGLKGQDVREWQQVLNRYGFEVATDGDFGSLTHTATVAWQTAYARFNDASRKPLVPDGQVGQNTRDRVAELERPKQLVAGELADVPPSALVPPLPIFALDPAGADITLTRVPVEPSSDVSTLAHELVRNLEATAAGAEDRELVSRFQTAHGLNATGSYGPATAEALIGLGIVPPKPRWWPSKKLWRAQHRYRVALREQAYRDPSRASEWLSAAQTL